MSELPDGPTRALTLLGAMALSTLVVILGLATGATQLSYVGLAAWFIALAATALWLVWKDRN